MKIRLPFQFPQAPPPPLALERTGREEGRREAAEAAAIISRISFGRLSLSEATRRAGGNHIREIGERGANLLSGKWTEHDGSVDLISWLLLCRKKTNGRRWISRSFEREANETVVKLKTHLTERRWAWRACVAL